MEHYFSPTPHTAHKPKRIGCSFFDRSFVFLTDASVFSRRKVDFGTRLLIEYSEVKKGDRLLDLGCGYGVVGIVLSFFCRNVIMVDINHRACELAQRNIKENKIKNAQVVCGSLGDVSGKFNVILFNPPLRAGKKVYLPLIEEAYSFLFEGGRIYVVARTTQGAKSLFDFMGSLYKTEYVTKKAGYRVIGGAV